MKKVLVLDACIRREESRTKKLLDRAVGVMKELHEDWSFEILEVDRLSIRFFDQESLMERDRLLAEGRRDHPRFDLAHQFGEADAIVIGAPFWDLSIPAALKVYIENISVDGITFGCNAEGLYGKCKAQWMYFLTTRGCAFENTDMENGARYLEGLCKMFGIDAFYEVHAEGLDMEGAEISRLMEAALAEAEHVAEGLVL